MRWSTRGTERTEVTEGLCGWETLRESGELRQLPSRGKMSVSFDDAKLKMSLFNLLLQPPVRSVSDSF